MNVVATVCDLSTVNLKVLKTLGVTASNPFFYHCGREVVSILDPPHLLKCTRNLLMKHNIECETELRCNNVTVKGKQNLICRKFILVNNTYFLLLFFFCLYLCKCFVIKTILLH